jgi:hypothetical protein
MEFSLVCFFGVSVYDYLSYTCHSWEMALKIGLDVSFGNM